MIKPASSNQITLRPLQEKDYPIIKEIYDYFIENSTSTFHTRPISIEELKLTIPTAHPCYKSYIIYVDDEICGYCYFSPYKTRQAYDRTAEVTLYLKPGYEGKGIGKQTLLAMEEIAIEAGFKVLLGIITAENTVSVNLFDKCGYEKCAHFKQVGEKFGRILDVLGYQKILP